MWYLTPFSLMGFTFIVKWNCKQFHNKAVIRSTQLGIASVMKSHALYRRETLFLSLLPDDRICFMPSLRLLFPAISFLFNFSQQRNVSYTMPLLLVNTIRTDFTTLQWMVTQEKLLQWLRMVPRQRGAAMCVYWSRRISNISGF